MISWGITVLAFLYFLQGVPYGLQSRFLPLYFRTHGMSLSNIGLFKLLLVPWMLKALWAPCIDHYGTKKQWLSYSMLGLLLTSLAASLTSPAYISQLVAVLLLFNILTATQDIAVDGLAIHMLATSELAAGNVAQVVGYKVGAVFSGGAITWLSATFDISWGTIFIGFAMVYCTAYFVIHVIVPDDDRTGSTSEKCHSSNADSHQESRESNLCSTSAKNTTEKDYAEQMKSQSEKYTRNVEIVDNKASESHDKNEQEQHWIIQHIREMLSTSETKWVLAYVLIYKLGEQGALSMVPLYLVDHGISTASVGFWTGVIGQSVSIAGSVMGGLLVSSNRFTPYEVVKLFSWFRLVPLTMFVVLTGLWSKDSEYIMYVSMVLCMSVMLLGSGIITTTTFTLMMYCSQRSPVKIQASHYTTLATVEVLGKLTFSVLIGSFTDLLGYETAFIIFVMLSLSVLMVLKKCPRMLIDMAMDQKLS